MENPDKFKVKDAFRNKSIKNKPTSKRTLFLIALTVIALGVGVTFYFTNRIESFFWEARTSSVGGIVHELAIHYLQNDDIANWQKQDEGNRLALFAKEEREYIPSTLAIKIYTADGTLAWTNLQGEKPGYKEPDIEIEIKDTADVGQLVKSASESTKQELGKTNLLEVWSTVENAQGESLGFVEIYFDTSDIGGFVTKVKYSIWFVMIAMLGVVLFMISIEFRKQDDFIIRQARELSNIVEHSPVGIYTIDTKGTVTSINSKMLELIGENNPEKIIGQNIIGITRIQRMNVASATEEALLGVPFDKETSCRDDDGSELHRHYRGTPLFKDDNKTVDHVLFIVEDITARKKIEKGLTTHTQDLEKSVDERTKELQTRIADLEQFERVTVGREIRMTELKQQIEKMRIKLESLGVDTDTL